MENILESPLFASMDIELTEEQRFLKKFLEETHMIKPIPTFNNWVRNRLPNQITSRNLDFIYKDVGYRVTFSNVEIEKPKFITDKKDANGKFVSVPLMPNKARLLENYSYQANVNATVNIEKWDGDKYTPDANLKSFNTTLCHIPVMVRSDLCNLDPKNKKALIEAEECPNDPGGYFIIGGPERGSERVIMTEESLRLNKIHIFPATERKNHNKKPKEKAERSSKNDKGKNFRETSFKYPSYDGISMVRIFTSENFILQVSFEIKKFGQKNANFTAPIFEMFEILNPQKFGSRDSVSDIPPPQEEEMYNWIKQFVVSDSTVWKKIQSRLAPSMAVYLSSDPVPFPKDIDNSRDTVISAFFSNCNGLAAAGATSELSTDNDYKLACFGLMIARTMEYLVGARELDDRDSWSNKRIETAGRRLEELFAGVLNQELINVKYVIHTIKDHRGEVDKFIENQLSNMRTEIDKQIHTCMKSIWAVKSSVKNKAGAYNKGNATESLKRETPMAIYSQVSRLTIPTRHTAGSSKLRMVQQTQAGYICVAETPEGETCGISKNIACTCFPSLDLNSFSAIFKVIHNIHQSIGGGINPRPVCLNGICVSFSNIVQMAEQLRVLKRTMELPQDTCIVVDGDILYVYCDGGRPVRPLFVVDKDGKLLIDKKQEEFNVKPNNKLNVWTQPLKTIQEYGVLEFIDAFEQEFIMLAPSIDAVRERKALNEEWKGLIAPFMTADVKCNNAILEEFKHHSFLCYASFSGDQEKDKLIKAARLSFEEYLELRASKITDFTNIAKHLRDKVGNVGLSFETCQRLDMLKIRLAKFPETPYTHCEISPLALLGVVGACNPAVNYNQAPRNTYQCKMAQQALSAYHSRVDMRFDTSFKKLNAPRRPMFDTMMNSLVGMDKMPAGATLQVAIMAVADNQEDAFIMKKEFIERDGFAMTKYITKTVKIRSEGGVTEIFKRPVYDATNANDVFKYKHIQDNGMPMIGARLQKDMCMVGKVIVRTKGSAGQSPEEENSSMFVKLDEEGIVDRVIVGTSSYIIKIRIPRHPMVGDKFASRYAQKGTVSRILPSIDMPTIACGPMAGVAPDLIINSHALPSRMTIGKAIEFVAAKAAFVNCKRVNATAFTEYNMQSFFKTLKDAGYNEHGYEKMMTKTGDLVESMIYMGPCYYQALRHNVLDKVQARGYGRHRRDNFQPVPGRSNEGGLRVGEMERDAFISHGATAFLHERLCGVSDQWDSVICRKCNMFIAGNPDTKTFFCNNCKMETDFTKEPESENVGVLTIPYVWKVLTQLLAIAGVHLTVKTDVMEKRQKQTDQAVFDFGGQLEHQIDDHDHIDEGDYGDEQETKELDTGGDEDVVELGDDEPVQEFTDDDFFS